MPHHHYSLSVILLGMRLQNATSSSFRSICISLRLFGGELLNSLHVSTLQMWSKRLGHYLLHCPLEPGGNWVIILDESVAMGSQKLLLILGFRLEDWAFDRPFCLEDLTPLFLGVGNHWRNPEISAAIDQVRQRVGGNICYAIADQGHAITKSLEQEQMVHLHDMKHRMAKIFEAIYQQDPDYQSISERMGQMRRRLSLSEVAHLLPPNQRVKNRFMNLDPIADWGNRVIETLNSPSIDLSPRAREELAWVEEYASFFQHISPILETKQALLHLLNTKGYSDQTHQLATQQLAQIKELPCPRAQQFAQATEACLTRMQQQCVSLGLKTLACSSEIIESALGTFKQRIAHNPMVGMTDLVLSLALCFAKITPEFVLQGLAETPTKMVKQWKKETLPPSLLAKRREQLPQVAKRRKQKKGKKT